jgi:hypothetical protein
LNKSERTDIYMSVTLMLVKLQHSVTWLLEGGHGSPVHGTQGIGTLPALAKVMSYIKNVFNEPGSEGIEKLWSDPDSRQILLAQVAIELPDYGGVIWR